MEEMYEKTNKTNSCRCVMLWSGKSDKSALSLGEINMDKVTVQAAENVSDITIDGNNINKENKNGLLIRDLVF